MDDDDPVMPNVIPMAEGMKKSARKRRREEIGDRSKFRERMRQVLALHEGDEVEGENVMPAEVDPDEPAAKRVFGSHAPDPGDRPAIQHGFANEEDVTEIQSALPADQWKFDEEYKRNGEDPRFVQRQTDSEEALTERHSQYCFLCSMSGDHSSFHESTLSSLWHAAIVSHPIFTAAKMVSMYYDANIRMFTEEQRAWSVRDVYEHFVMHCIDERTLTVVMLRDHMRIAHHQMGLLNTQTTSGRLLPVDPAAVSVYSRLCQVVLKLRRDLANLGSS